MSQSKFPNSLDDLLSGNFDTFGLLSDVKPAKPKVDNLPPTVLNFLEIVEFYRANDRLPSIDATDINEKRLAARLTAYKTRLRKSVEAYDDLGILDMVEGQEPVRESKIATATPGSLDDIMACDPNGLLKDVDVSILKIENVRSQSADDRNWPDEIATRKPCEDFYNYEKLFHDMQRDIANRKVEVIRFRNETQLEVGHFFILSGLICFVDSVLDDRLSESERNNPRLRVIFENGIETNILKFSLSRALYKDPHGRRILPNAQSVENQFNGITHRDKATGCIYILASQTKSPVLSELKAQGRLVKIGYSSQDVYERIKNAENDPTYLEAPVTVLATLDCYNLNPQKVEHLIHAFLAKQRINMTLISSKGKPYKPTEWFMVDRDTAVAVAEHIVAGDIMNYRMDNTTGRIKSIK